MFCGTLLIVNGRQDKTPRINDIFILKAFIQPGTMSIKPVLRKFSVTIFRKFGIERILTMKVDSKYI